MSFIEQMRQRLDGVESCCDGGRMCGETEGVDLRPDTYPYELSTSGEQATIQQRGEVYGPPEINLPAIGLHWTALLRQAFGRADIPEITGTLVAQMFAAAKLSRLARSPGHEDSEHDLRTYLTLACSLAERESLRSEQAQPRSAAT